MDLGKEVVQKPEEIIQSFAFQEAGVVLANRHDQTDCVLPDSNFLVSLSCQKATSHSGKNARGS